jgi:hypothetical protein
VKRADAVSSADTTADTTALDSVTASFASAVLRASAPKLAALAASGSGAAVQSVAVVAQLTSALALAGAVPPASWMSALQAATLPTLALAPEADTAELAWAVAKLARQRAAAPDTVRALYASAAMDAGNQLNVHEEAAAVDHASGIVPAWLEALQQVCSVCLLFVYLVEWGLCVCCWDHLP